MSTSNNATNSFPFHAEDLPPGVRLRTGDHRLGIQGHGEDISAYRHLGDNRWSRFTADAPEDKSQHKNEHHVVYGLPFYAVADGEVIGAWRNAPENPAPGESHPARQEDQNGNRFILGGGNHLWIRHDDGVIALYAHAQPGTIPSELCPHPQTLTLQPIKKPGGNPDVNPQAFVPPGVPPSVPTGSTIMINGVWTVVTRPRVHRGQLLGLVGNSGKSANPHLHFHEEKGGAPFEIIFDRGLATPLQRINEENIADIDEWNSFAGEALPSGPILVWPPRSLGAEFARHQYDPDDFSRLFDHLEDSGYQPVWFDGYRVGDDVFYNFIWRPATTSWRMFRALTFSEYQQERNVAFQDGFSPVHVESYLNEGGDAHYAVIFNKDGEKDVVSRHGITLDERRTAMNTAREHGLSPKAVSVVSVEGALQYTVLYRREDIGEWEIHSRIPIGEFQQKFDEMNTRGMGPHYAAAYRHDGVIFFSVIFASKDSGKLVTHFGLNPDTYQDAWEEHRGEGKLTLAVAGYDGALSEHRYIAIWK